MSYRVYDTNAIVVRHWPYREASTRFWLYTRDLGRILARAQSIRKVTSKLAGGLQTGSRSEVELVCGKAGWRVVGCQPGTNYLLCTSAHQQQIISRFFRLLNQLVPDQQHDPYLYQIISAGLMAVKNSTDTAEQKAQEKLLVLRTLVQLGYAPDPDAAALEPFIYSADYGASVISSFQPHVLAAVGQINQSLKTIQL
ncbi:MAG: recombination protein O N-terminal domain-containing protein [Candidatus Paceibacterota bacterium]